MIADYKIFPKSRPLVLMSPGVTFDVNSIPDGTTTDRTMALRYSMNFRSNLRVKQAVVVKVYL